MHMIHAECLTNMCVSITIQNHDLYLCLTGTNILVLILLACFIYKLKKAISTMIFLKFILVSKSRSPVMVF